MFGSEARQVRHGIRVRFRSGGGNERGGAGGRVVWKLEFDGGLPLKSARLGRRPLQMRNWGHSKVAATVVVPGRIRRAGSLRNFVVSRERQVE